MEAKLRELEASKPKHNTEPGTSTLPTSSLPTHPSLPPKPPLTVPDVGVPQSQNPIVSKQSLTASFAPLSRSSTLNHHSPTGCEPLTKKIKLASTSGPPEVAKRKSSGKGLLGVKIVKKWTSPSPVPPSSDDHSDIVDHHHNQEPPVPSSSSHALADPRTA